MLGKVVKKICTCKAFDRELYERQVLDKYLARALSLPLSEVTEVVATGTQYKTLELVDNNNYVLTLDYALKMINIHERRECGMPVIIEGETGVGKTELLKMLSKLWNYRYEAQLRHYKQKLKEILDSIKKSNSVQKLTILAFQFLFRKGTQA